MRHQKITKKTAKTTYMRGWWVAYHLFDLHTISYHPKATKRENNKNVALSCLRLVVFLRLERIHGSVVLCVW